MPSWSTARVIEPFLTLVHIPHYLLGIVFACPLQIIFFDRKKDWICFFFVCMWKLTREKCSFFMLWIQTKRRPRPACLVRVFSSMKVLVSVDQITKDLKGFQYWFFFRICSLVYIDQQNVTWIFTNYPHWATFEGSMRFATCPSIDQSDV